MIRAACLLAVLAGPATGQSLCDVLDQHDGDTLELEYGRASCRESLALGGASNVHCVLEFSYRSEDAARVFEALVQEITACVGRSATVTTDQSVNHPDAYDLREFQNGTQAYAVSIKDKGALQQTLVFVRVSRS